MFTTSHPLDEARIDVRRELPPINTPRSNSHKFPYPNLARQIFSTTPQPHFPN